MNKLLIVCMLMLAGCDFSDMAEKKCIDGEIYRRDGNIWVKAFRDTKCQPVETKQ